MEHQAWRAMPPRAVRRWGMGALAVAAAAAVAACGSTQSASSSSDAHGTTTASVAAGSAKMAGPASYDGPAAALPQTFPVPKKVNRALKIGYLQIDGALPTLVVQQGGAEKQAQALGAQLIVKDAQLNPQTQVAQFQQLLEQGVNAIVVYPVVPTSLGPELAAAKKAGIPVISTNARPAVTQPLPAGYTADLEAPLDREAFAMAQSAAQQQPGAQFGVIGTALPVAALKYLATRERYWGTRFGLKFDGEADAQQDTAAGYGPAITQLLTQNPGLQQVWVYNDLLALTATTVVRSSGHSDVKIFSNSGAQAPVVDGIKAGRIAMAYQVPWAQQGAALIDGAYDEATHQHLPLPRTVSLTGTVITKANADSVAPTR